MSARLLFDENLPPGLVHDLADVFPGSTHVRDVGLQAASDDRIWTQAATDDRIWTQAATSNLQIVTKDDDFRQRSFLHGFPPKVVWLRVGNCSRRDIAAVLRRNVAAIERFVDDPEAALLILTRQSDPRSGAH